MWDAIWVKGRLATMTSPGASPGPGTPPFGAIEDGAIAVNKGTIAWVGPAADLPGPPDTLARRVYDLAGRWLTPGLIDCHTHLVYGGDRAEEFELRLQGTSYAEIARAGGGIAATVSATRAAGEADLLKTAARRLKTLLAEGVTTIEIKSGYGLELETELKQLRVARRLGSDHPVQIKTSFLGAHALPGEFRDRAEDYIDAVVAMMPLVKASGLADAVDAFCENIAFSTAQTARVFEAAVAQGLPVKLHADQLSDSGGAALAARYGALSADHLEYSSAAGIAAMAQAGCVAVLLPGAFYVLGETQRPPIEALRRAGVPMALGTDCNPGSAPVTSLLLVLNLACTLFRLTPAEAFAGVTRNGAKALGLGATHGTLEPGKAADLAIWEIERPAELAYRIGFNPLAVRVQAGVVIETNE